MSSLDSVLLVAASVVTRDIRMELAPVTDAGAVAWTRGGIIAFAALAALIALNPPGDIVEITIFSGSLYVVYFAPAVLFGLHWRRGSATAALAGGAVGIAVLLVWLALGWQVRLHEVFPALAASALVYVTLAFVTRPVEDSRVSAFFAPAAVATARSGAAPGRRRARRVGVKIKLTSVHVNDQQRALDFYTNVLGFEQRQDLPAGEFRVLTVAAPGSDVELMLEPDAHPAAQAYCQALRQDGIPVAMFFVADLEAEHRRLTALGVRFERAPTRSEWGYDAVLDDTCGNLIALHEE